MKEKSGTFTGGGKGGEVRNALTYREGWGGVEYPSCTSNLGKEHSAGEYGTELIEWKGNISCEPGQHDWIRTPHSVELSRLQKEDRLFQGRGGKSWTIIPGTFDLRT